MYVPTNLGILRKKLLKFPRNVMYLKDLNIFFIPFSYTKQYFVSYFCDMYYV